MHDDGGQVSIKRWLLFGTGEKRKYLARFVTDNESDYEHKHIGEQQAQRGKRLQVFVA